MFEWLSFLSRLQFRFISDFVCSNWQLLQTKTEMNLNCSRLKKTVIQTFLSKYFGTQECYFTFFSFCQPKQTQQGRQMAITHNMNYSNWLYSNWQLFPSVLWHCWLGVRKGIRPVKTELWGAGVVVWSEMHTCIWPSRFHCHSLSVASVKSRLVLPFWYWLTWVVPDKGPLNGCVCVCVCNW